MSPTVTTVVRVARPATVTTIVPSVPILPRLLVTGMTVEEMTVTVPRAKLLRLPAEPAVQRSAITGGGPGAAVVATPEEIAKVTKAVRVVGAVTVAPEEVGYVKESYTILSILIFLLPFVLFVRSQGIMAVDNESLVERVVPPITVTPTPVCLAWMSRVTSTPPFTWD